MLAGRLHSERRRDPCRLKPSGPNPVQVPETTNGDPRRESPSSRLTCCYSLWSHGESNPRPLVCKTSALPTELWPLGPGYENPGHQAEHTFFGRPPCSSVPVPGYMNRHGTKPWAAPRDVCPPTSSCCSRAFRGSTHGACLRPPGGILRGDSAGQLSPAAVASVHRSSSARSAWILR